MSFHQIWFWQNIGGVVGIIGAYPRSVRRIERIRKLCSITEHPGGCYSLMSNVSASCPDSFPIETVALAAS